MILSEDGSRNHLCFEGKLSCGGFSSFVRITRFLRNRNRNLVCLGLLLALTGCASLPGEQQTRTASGLRPIAVAGSGRPVIVFEAGAGDGLETWNKVFPEAAKLSTVFAYSLRGYGMSFPTLGSRTGEDVVYELRQLLAAQHLTPPYMLVGHSIGGLYMELFAKLHPDEVVGLILVDPTHPDHLERMKAERPGNYRVIQTAKVLTLANTLGAELRGIDDTGRQWHVAPPLPNRPAIVLTAQRSSPLDGPAFAEFTGKLQTELVESWPGAEQRFIDSTHYIQREKPEAVAQAIKDLLSRVRTTK